MSQEKSNRKRKPLERQDAFLGLEQMFFPFNKRSRMSTEKTEEILVVPPLPKLKEPESPPAQDPLPSPHH